MKRSIIVLTILVVVVVGYVVLRGHGAPTAIPSVTPAHISTPTVSHTPTPTLSPRVPGSTPTPTPTPTQSVTPTPVQSQSPSPMLSSTVTPTVTPTPTAQSHTVLLQNYAFVPSALTVTKGDPVVFQAVDAFYSITVGNARSSGRLQPGQTWTLNSGDFSPGTYSLTESTHAYMRGTLTIQ
jgi:hypothetical protein